MPEEERRIPPGAVIGIGLGLAAVGGAIGLAYTLTRKPVPPVVFTCPYCGVEFTTEGDLNYHIQTEHPEVPPVVYTCPYCGVEFITEGDLNYHIQTEHPPAVREYYIDFEPKVITAGTPFMLIQRMNLIGGKPYVIVTEVESGQYRSVFVEWMCPRYYDTEPMWVHCELGDPTGRWMYFPSENPAIFEAQLGFGEGTRMYAGPTKDGVNEIRGVPQYIVAGDTVFPPGKLDEFLATFYGEIWRTYLAADVGQEVANWAAPMWINTRGRHKVISSCFPALDGLGDAIWRDVVVGEIEVI